jgi:hypothetical protein
LKLCHVAHVPQAYGSRATTFGSEEKQLPFLDIEEYHLTQQAVRHLLRRVRKELLQTDQYAESKLAQLDQYEVKLTELSLTEIVIRPGIHEPSMRQRAAWDNRFVVKESAPKKRRGRPTKSK